MSISNKCGALMIEAHIVKDFESLQAIADYYQSEDVSGSVAISFLKIAQLASSEIEALKKKIKELENAK